MKLASSVFFHNQKIPSKFTCDGENVSPSLTISDVPKLAKSLVLVVDDPDAPSKVWVHWVLFNIDPQTTTIPEGSIPKNSILGMTDFGFSKYGGPCPPTGTHRYFFKLYALDAKLALNERSDKIAVETAMRGHILDSSELIGLYSRE